MKKLNIGIFSFTGDEGCVMTILEIFNYKYKEWFDKLNIKHFKLLTSRSEIKDIDVSFVEGAISTEGDVKRIKEVRENSKFVVAIGSCAITGYPSNNRNFFDSKTNKEISGFIRKFKYLKKVEPIGKYVKVDDKVPGCPIIEEEFVRVMDKYMIMFGVKNA